MNITSALYSVFIIISLLALPITGCAQDGHGREDRKGPPPEAIAACKNMQEGDSVSFTDPRGQSHTGICQTIENQLVAVPEGHKGRPEGR